MLTAALQARLAELEKTDLINVIVKVLHIDDRMIKHLLDDPENKLRNLIKDLRGASFASLRVPVSNVGRLAADPHILRIEEDRQMFAMLDTSVALVGANEVWVSGFKGRGVKVAVVDTGIDAEHPDLKDSVQSYRDFTGEGSRDPNGHGTHVAGVIAGRGTTSKGKYTGVAPEATLIGAKVLKADGTGLMSDVMAGIVWSIECGAKVICLALGTHGPAEVEDALCDICYEAGLKGALIVTAAGNDGPERGTLGSPAVSKDAVTVAACNDDLQVLDFSSRGPTLEGRMKPDVVAIGADVIAARAYGVEMGLEVDAEYTSATGTSLAASHVAGIAALLFEARKDASAFLIKEAILFTARDLGFAEIVQGKGLIQATKALDYVLKNEQSLEFGMHGGAPTGCLSTLINLPKIGYHELFKKRT